jgi:hypothetical protein
MAKTKLNCWEFKNCGREKGGLLADVLGVCPVAKAMKYDGVHGGRAAGRICWKIRNSSSCEINLTDSQPSSCHDCSFYRRVQHEEADKSVHQFASVTDTSRETPARLPAAALKH